MPEPRAWEGYGVGLVILVTLSFVVRDLHALRPEASANYCSCSFFAGLGNIPHEAALPFCKFPLGKHTQAKKDPTLTDGKPQVSGTQFTLVDEDSLGGRGGYQCGNG